MHSPVDESLPGSCLSCEPSLLRIVLRKDHYKLVRSKRLETTSLSALGPAGTLCCPFFT